MVNLSAAKVDLSRLGNYHKILKRASNEKHKSTTHLSLSRFNKSLCQEIEVVLCSKIRLYRHKECSFLEHSVPENAKTVENAKLLGEFDVFKGSKG